MNWYVPVPWTQFSQGVMVPLGSGRQPSWQQQLQGHPQLLRLCWVMRSQIKCSPLSHLEPHLLCLQYPDSRGQSELCHTVSWFSMIHSPFLRSQVFIFPFSFFPAFNSSIGSAKSGALDGPNSTLMPPTTPFMLPGRSMGRKEMGERTQSHTTTLFCRYTHGGRCL